MEQYYFQTQKMCVGYDGKPIIKDIEITLPKGEILTLIGPNGAGKSTVLKSIAGQLRLLDGVVYLGKELLSEMSGNERAKKISVVFTDRLQTELMTCREVVATGRYPYTGRFGVLSKEDERIVDEVIALVQITDICDQDFRKISDGQRQRVLLARAICQEPELLILDEPTSYLDIRYQLEFLSVLQEMRKKKGLTVIMSLHELELAKRISDKLLCLKGAYIDRYGTPAEIFNDRYIGQLFDIPKSSLKQIDSTLLAYVEQIETW
ncbi:MAG: ABC transporter ATP-binding protein [Lachnospiraceae bacterium]|nr:ABC transporter ATP-binding protein [Lachnospiraceae bacterium]